jgi:transposase
VRARLAWKYLLGLELTDPGVDFSVLSACRDRLLAGRAEELLLAKRLARCQTRGLRKGRGPQRTDSTQVVAAIRALNRVELVADTLRAALNALATAAPEWLRAVAPPAWYERYGRRIEDSRLPRDQAERAAYAQMVGEDGVALLDALEVPEVPAALQTLPRVEAWRRAWQRHDDRPVGEAPVEGAQLGRPVRFKTHREWPPAAESIDSPDDLDARYRHTRDTQWTGSRVHISETCESSAPPLLTHVHTTTAVVHEAQGTEPIQHALVAKQLPPSEPFVDAASMDAELLVHSREAYGITLRGPARPNPNWPARVEGAYPLTAFVVDWERQQVHCPQGHSATSWTERGDATRATSIQVRFRRQDCRACAARALCTQATQAARTLKRHPQAQEAALQAARAWYASPEGKQGYTRRAGIEGTLSQGVRAFGLRHMRYRGLPKTHLQHVATAAAMHVDRTVAWLDERPQAKTRISRFAALAPTGLIPPETPSV